MTMLTCFLNELDTFSKRQRRTFNKQDSYDRHTTFFIFEDKNAGFKIKIMMTPNISVVASNEWIRTHWERIDSRILSTKGKGRKTLKTPQIRHNVAYRWIISELRDGTKSLILHNNLMFNSPDDFSHCLYYFGPTLDGYMGDLEGYETVQVTQQDGRTLTLEGEQAAALKELLARLSFAGAAEEEPGRANSAPGFEAVVHLESNRGTACSVTFVTSGPEDAHVRLGLPDGTEVHIVGAFQAEYRATADFVNALPE